MPSGGILSRSSMLVYLVLTMSWSGITFTVLLPSVKNVLYSKCVWRFNFVICNRFFGIEGAYRFTSSIVLFYMLLSLVTINFHGNEFVWSIQDSIVVKIVLFVLSHALGFLVSLSRHTMEIFYNASMFFSYVFFMAMYVLMIDAAHAFRMIWIRFAKNTEEPTCYFCTWLFVTHLITAFLYAISLDLFLAFFFFNTIENCISTLLYLLINTCLCFLCFTLSYYPSLRDRQASSQVIFATVLFYVMFVSWIALSDPENSECDMYGTIFTGSLLDSSTNFRSLALLSVALPPLLFLCFKEPGSSYLWDLVAGSNCSIPNCLIYPRFFFILAISNCYTLMSVTNYYEPVFSIIQTFGTEKRAQKTSVIYFEGENPVRYVMVTALSTILPIFYLFLLLVHIGRDLMELRRLQKKERQQKLDEVNQDGSSVFKESSKHQIEFLYVQITEKEAINRLTKIPPMRSSYTPSNATRFLLLPCFLMPELGLTFWNFPKHISQTYFNGRNGSNACTVISIIIGRFFSRSDLTYQNCGYLGDDWSNLFYTSIEEGNTLYDSLVKELGVLDLSIEEVHEKLGSNLNIAAILPSLAVSFESDVETVTILYQLRRLVAMQRKLVVLFIHNKRTSSFLVYGDGDIVYADSHAFGEDGALMITANSDTLSYLVTFLKNILGDNSNRLATLTVLEYERRRINDAT